MPYHRQTEHTWESVRQGSGGNGLDWSCQPQVFKSYPEPFVEVSLEELPELKEFLFLSCGLSAKKVYPGGTSYLRVNPSAGALYPCELYLQARDVAGLKDGIYHVMIKQPSLRLLYPLPDNEGIEGWCSNRQRVSGLVLLVTSLYYRSAWKYRSRAFRFLVPTLEHGNQWGMLD